MPKPVRVLPLAARDVRSAAAWYQKEGGPSLTLKWIKAIESSLAKIGAQPRIGSPRFAATLGIPELRCWRVRKFPYLIFYCEREMELEVWRVLHASNDVPAWMSESE